MMKRILAPILLLTLLFPSLAQGQSLNDWVAKGEGILGKGKGFLCETTGVGCPESVDFKDLVERDDVYFKKLTDVPFTGKVTGKSQGSIKDGEEDGPWVQYWKNGQLFKKGTFKDGKRDGPWVEYHDNGQLWSKGTLKDGKEDGPWVYYHDNGQLYSKGTYKNSKEHGPWVTYQDDGQLWHKGTYKNGMQHGPWVGYNKDGTVWETYTGTFRDGVKVD
jgi:antitoxin component YwqK of YwqJK toxin-antitoxin module